jgi:LPXTG-motif cell wall-anchored protein
MRTVTKLLLTTIALSALVVLLAGPVGAQEYPPSEGGPSAPAGGEVTGGRAGAAQGTTTGGLARTGSSDTLPLVWIGVGAVALGGVLLIGVRRSHQVRARNVHL